MVVRRISIKGLLLVAFALLAGSSLVLAKPRGLPAQDGIVNFGQINEKVYRGAQPDAAGIQALQKRGIKTIINLRMAGDVWGPEEAAARTAGILYTNVPFRGFGRPTDEQVANVLSLIETLPGPVFIHCQHGCDRTGTIIACYRIRHDAWSREQAMKEAIRYGMSWFERGMRKYVVDFAKSDLLKAPSFKDQPPVKLQASSSNDQAPAARRPLD